MCPLQEAAVSPAGEKPSTADVSFPFQTHPLGSCFLPLLWERRDSRLPLSPPPHPWLSIRDVSQGECAQYPGVTEWLSHGLAKLLAFGVGFCLSLLFFFGCSLASHGWAQGVSSGAASDVCQGAASGMGCAQAPTSPVSPSSLWQLPDPGISRASGFIRMAVCRRFSAAVVLGPCPQHLGPAIKDFL